MTKASHGFALYKTSIQVQLHIFISLCIPKYGATSNQCNVKYKWDALQCGLDLVCLAFLLFLLLHSFFHDFLEPLLQSEMTQGPFIYLLNGLIDAWTILTLGVFTCIIVSQFSSGLLTTDCLCFLHEHLVWAVGKGTCCCAFVFFKFFLFEESRQKHWEALLMPVKGCTDMQLLSWCVLILL